ncbi:hypothetical protein GR210_12415 [Rhizobium leguminosarum]|uniref:hypothetical protein n=1 Tax=Rhizobium leguminosarum TaxID=384 RepID=UPI0013D94090|nr:hypothetical protein [Rhizobium leguminosarum]NEH49586.1 hypothetical protein [Rhizobium leguminosarum]
MDRSQQQLFLLFALLLFYCLGPCWALGALVVASTGPGNEIEGGPGTIVNILSIIAANPGAYTGIIHQMIVPVVAAVTAANYSNIFSAKGQQWLFIIPLVTIFVCLVDAVFVNVFYDSFQVATTSDNKSVNVSGAVAQLFLSTASTLTVYVMLLVGLKVGEKA